MSRLEDVQHRFEWDAANFAAIYKSESSLGWRLFNRLFRRAIFVRYEIAMTEAGNVKGSSVLDIGCGSGIYSIELARRGAARVVGLDFSEPMLAMARDDARQAGTGDNTEFVRDEFARHDFGADRFDVSIAMGVFDYLEEAEPFLTKMAALTTRTVIASFPRFSLVRGTARRLRYRLSRRGDVYYYTSDEIDRLAQRAGIPRHRLVHIGSSGGGVVLVGDMTTSRP